MKIAVAADHAAFCLKNEIASYLKSLGHEVKDFGTYSEDSVDYPDYAAPAAKAVASGDYQYGIIICGSGIGVSIVCNKIAGIRAANCLNEDMAILSRLHNNANVLNMGARFTQIDEAKRIVDVFLKTDFEGGRHINRVEKVHSLTGR